MNNVRRKQIIYKAVLGYNKSRAKQYLRMRGIPSALATKNLLYYLKNCKRFGDTPECHTIGRIVRKAALGESYYPKLDRYRFYTRSHSTQHQPAYERQSLHAS